MITNPDRTIPHDRCDHTGHTPCGEAVVAIVSSRTPGLEEYTFATAERRPFCRRHLDQHGYMDRHLFDAPTFDVHWLTYALEPWDATIDPRTAELADMILRQRRDTITRDFSAWQANGEAVGVRPGKKYTKIDVGTWGAGMSGKYMIDDATGDIYGIKAYGVVHRGHHYGTLDTIHDWYWGGYTAFPNHRVAPDIVRAEALKRPNTAPMLNGRCVGQTSNGGADGTILTVIHCECPNGEHVPWDGGD